MVPSTGNIDYNIFVDTYGEPTTRPEVPFRHDENLLVVRENQISCDLYATALSRPAYVPPRDDLRLRLDALG